MGHWGVTLLTLARLDRLVSSALSVFRPGWCWAAKGWLSAHCGQKAGGLLRHSCRRCPDPQKWRPVSASTWLGFLTGHGSAMVLSPKCDIICGSGTTINWSPWHLWLCTAGRSRPVAVLLLPFVGGIPSVHGAINLIPRRVVWDSLGFTPPLGSPPDFIWNSVDPYCTVLTDMK